MQAMQLVAAATPLQSITRPRRPLEKGELRIRVCACAVCCTDLHVVDGELKGPHYPIIPGHEIIGRMIELGLGTTAVQEGDRVSDCPTVQPHKG